MGSLLSTQTTAGAITVSDGSVGPFQMNRQIVSKRLDWEASQPTGGGHVTERAVAQSMANPHEGRLNGVSQLLIPGGSYTSSRVSI